MNHLRADNGSETALKMLKTKFKSSQDILVNKFLFIIMFIAYQAADLDVLTGSTQKINFQKAMGPDMMHLPYSCLCFCESFNWFRS